MQRLFRNADPGPPLDANLRVVLARVPTRGTAELVGTLIR